MRVGNKELFRRLLYFAYMFCIVGALTSCAMMGVKPLNDKSVETFTDQRMVNLLDPANKSQYVDCDSTKGKNSAVASEPAVDLAFYCAQNGYDTAHRTYVQETLIEAANRRCYIYEEDLSVGSKTANFINSGITTTLTGVGSIVTGAVTLRALAASATANSAYGAAFNDQFFLKATVETLIPLIDAKRKELLDDMRGKKDDSMRTYGVKRALNDALDYNNACSLQAALNEVAKLQSKADTQQAISTIWETKYLETYRTFLSMRVDSSDTAALQSMATNLKLNTAGQTDAQLKAAIKNVIPTLSQENLSNLFK